MKGPDRHEGGSLEAGGHCPDCPPGQGGRDRRHQGHQEGEAGIWIL